MPSKEQIEDWKRYIEEQSQRESAEFPEATVTDVRSSEDPVEPTKVEDDSERKSATEQSEEDDKPAQPEDEAKAEQEEQNASVLGDEEGAKRSSRKKSEKSE